MSPVETLLLKLPVAKNSGKGWSARCPAHDDRKANLSMPEGDDGRVLMKCHVGCTAESAATGPTLNARDLAAASEISGMIWFGQLGSRVI
jgi:putative DNA primase/helicase